MDTFCHTIRYRNLVLRLGTEYGIFGPQNDFLGVYGDKNLVYCLQLSGNPSHFQGIPAASKGSMQLLGGPCCFQGVPTASKGSMPLSGGFYRFQGVHATPRGSLLHPEGFQGVPATFKGSLPLSESPCCPQTVPASSMGSPASFGGCLLLPGHPESND